MIARVAVWKPMPDDDRQWVIDAAKTVPGVLDAYHLIDPTTGNGLSIAFFDDDVDVVAVKAAISRKAEDIGCLKASRPIGDQTHGVGARRQVDLKPISALVETVTAWEEGRTIATTNQPSALVPFKQAESRLTLEPDDDGTAITFDYRYVPRGGPMGRLTGLVIDRRLRTDFQSMLVAIEEGALNAG